MGAEWQLALSSHAPLHALFSALLAFAASFGTAMAGIAIARRLPEHHLANDNRKAIKVALALLSMLLALVLGLMIADAKDTFDLQSGTMRRLSAGTILLDRILGQYGPETGHARALLRGMAVHALARLEGHDPSTAATSIEPHLQFHEFVTIIGNLVETSPMQRTLRARASELIAQLGEQRLELYVQQDQGMPSALLVSVLGWLAILFAGYGLLSPRNVVGVLALLASSVGLAAAIFLVEELGAPLDGIVRVSAAPLRDAVAVLGQ